MQLKTNIIIPKGKFSLSYPSSILSIGSCFAQNIYNTFHPLKFNVLSNPFGVIYNPISLFDSILPLKNSKDLNERIIKREDLFVHFDYHSDIKHETKDGLIKLIIEKQEQKNQFIKEAETLILTLGTAYYYQPKRDDLPVANCHKIPAKDFDRLLFNSNQIQIRFEKLIEYLNTVNPDIKIIITVSPVRHLSDGLSENNLSKSILRVFAHQAASSFSNVDYFPAFEILNDDLRDYRFYQKDLIHPNEIAIEYVLEKFLSTYFETVNLDLISKVKSIIRDLTHRPFNHQGKGYKKHLESVLKKIQSLNGLIDFELEREDVLKKINS